jgi:hypothetical protein
MGAASQPAPGSAVLAKGGVSAYADPRDSQDLHTMASITRVMRVERTIGVAHAK